MATVRERETLPLLKGKSPANERESVMFLFLAMDKGWIKVIQVTFDRHLSRCVTFVPYLCTANDISYASVILYDACLFQGVPVQGDAFVQSPLSV